MSNNSNQKYVRVRQLAWQVLDESVLILEPKTKKAHELNSVASFIWQKLDGAKSKEQITALVAEEYDVGIEVIQKDVDKFIETLEEGQLIECL